MITLNRAIEMLTFEEKATLPPRNDKFWNAIRLGREALRRIKATRLVRKQGTVVLLPGEEKEEEKL